MAGGKIAFRGLLVRRRLIDYQYFVWKGIEHHYLLQCLQERLLSQVCWYGDRHGSSTGRRRDVHCLSSFCLGLGAMNAHCERSGTPFQWRSSLRAIVCWGAARPASAGKRPGSRTAALMISISWRSEEHTSELQSLRHLVCRLL